MLIDIQFEYTFYSLDKNAYVYSINQKENNKEDIRIIMEKVVTKLFEYINSNIFDIFFLTKEVALQENYIIHLYLFSDEKTHSFLQQNLFTPAKLVEVFFKFIFYLI